jgi:hypothetical protein
MHAPYGSAAQVYRYGNLPMWPSRLWLWWCDGLSVFEALLVAGWTTAHIIGIKEMFVYYEARNHTCECHWQGTAVFVAAVLSCATANHANLTLLEKRSDQHMGHG